MKSNIGEQLKQAETKRLVLMDMREAALRQQEDGLADSIEFRIIKVEEHIQQLNNQLKQDQSPYMEKLKAYRGNTQLEDTIAKLIVNQAQTDSTDVDKIFWNVFGYGVNTGIFNSLVYANDFKQFFIGNMYEIIDEYNLLHKHDEQYKQLDIENIVCEVIVAIMQRIAVLIGIIRLD